MTNFMFIVMFLEFRLQFCTIIIQIPILEIGIGHVNDHLL